MSDDVEVVDQVEDISPTEAQQERIDDQGDALVITLFEPMTYRHSKLDGDRTLTTLTLSKRIKGKHLKKMDQATGEIDKSLSLIAALAGIPSHAVDELDVRDMELCMVALEPFLPERRVIGKP